jgi:hypothetical protein
MKNQIHIQILEALANGFNPLTGDSLEENNIYHKPEIIRALFAAVKSLEQIEIPNTLPVIPNKAALPVNAGKPWSRPEDIQLGQKFDDGISITELSRIHNRTSGAIRSRLIKLGKLTVLSDETPF